MRTLPAWVILAVLLTNQRPVGAETESERVVQARQHFELGVAAFEQRRFAEAAREFRAAYELSPTYLVLYNIGQVSAALGQAVESVDAFQAYLDQGGSTISGERRAAVLVELEKQQALIGTLAIRAKPDGATVHIDGKSVGITPLEVPIRLAAGKHSVVVLREGFETHARELRIYPGAENELAITLEKHRDANITGSSPTSPVVVVAGPGAQTSMPSPTIVNVQVPQQSGGVLAEHQRTAGYVLGGLGVGVIGVGVYLNINALADAHDAKSRGDNQAWSDAKTRNYWGWGTIGAGAVVAMTGAVLFITAPSSSLTSRAIRVAPFSDGHACGLIGNAVW